MKAMQKNTTLSGSATSEQISEWKEKHGAIFQYTIDGMTCYFRTVDRNTYSLAVAKMSTNPAKFNEIVIENIWLGGDDTIRKDDKYYFGLIDHVEDLMAKKKGSLQSL